MYNIWAQRNIGDDKIKDLIDEYKEENMKVGCDFTIKFMW